MPPVTTYGKRSVKRKNTLDTKSSETLGGDSSTAAVIEERLDDVDELLLQPTRPVAPKKRRVDSMQPSMKKRRDAPVNGTTEDDGTPEPAAGEGAVSKPKPRVIATYGTPKKASTSLTASAQARRETNHSIDAQKPETPSGRRMNAVVRGRVEVTASSEVSPAASSRPNSPTKLSKRMLSRSKTDTTIAVLESNPFSPTSISRTQSLSVLPSPTKGPSAPHFLSRSPSRTDTLPDLTSNAPSTSNLPLLTASLTTTVSRTYAGKSRSYLVPLGPTGTGLTAADNGVEEEEDEFSRESYAALRERWGVDQSEDDPYYYEDAGQQGGSQSPASPSKKNGRSGTSTPSGSPSKRQTTKAPVVRPPPLPPGMMNPLKSITELRNKGESRRFLDEVAYLLDGMVKSQGAGLIRASALEMATKLCDADFFRKAKISDVFSKVYELFLNVGVARGDKVLDTLFAFFMVLVSKDPPSLAELASHRSDTRGPPSAPNNKGKGKAPTEEPSQALVDILFSMLDSVTSSGLDPLSMVAPNNEYSDAQSKRAGLGKKEKVTMTSIHSAIAKKSNMFPDRSKITTSLLITHILQSLNPSLISQRHLPVLLASLQETLRPLSEWSSRQPSWKLSLNLDPNVDFENVYAHLRLLDLYLLGQWAGGDDQSQSQPKDGQDGESSVNNVVLATARKEWLVKGLIALGIHAEVALKRERDGDGQEDVDVDYGGAIRCLESVLRVLVSLTHGDGDWARSVVLESAWALRFLMRVLAKSGEDVAGGDERKDEGGSGDEGRGDKVSVTQNRAEKRAEALDRLCLCLALLTNLMQTVDEVRDLIRETYLDPQCGLLRGQCLDACSCARVKNSSALEILVRLYVRHSEAATPSANRRSSSNHTGDGEGGDNEEQQLQIDADASFLRGHLAVLFGLCMQGNAENQRVLLDLLPEANNSHRRAKLNRLVDQARQFVAFFAVVEGESQDVQRESSSRVGSDIVRFLEELRDAA